MEALRKKIPEIHRKAWIIGGIGGFIGAGIGGYFSALYAGLGAAIGYILGIVISLFVSKKVALKTLETGANMKNRLGAILSLIMTIYSIIVFIETGRAKAIAGVLFFGGGTVYLLRKKN